MFVLRQDLGPQRTRGLSEGFIRLTCQKTGSSTSEKQIRQDSLANEGKVVKNFILLTFSLDNVPTTSETFVPPCGETKLQGAIFFYFDSLFVIG